MFQLMRGFPDCRLAAAAPPFSYTAFDYFGSVETAYARNHIAAKRWGALFTCQVTRAVYLGVVVSLSLDDFLLILWRFIGLYGSIRRFHLTMKPIWSEPNESYVNQWRNCIRVTESTSSFYTKRLIGISDQLEHFTLEEHTNHSSVPPKMLFMLPLRSRKMYIVTGPQQKIPFGSYYLKSLVC